MILFACTISGLVLYRFKNYAYILLLVPAFDIVMRKIRQREVPYSALFVFVFCLRIRTAVRQPMDVVSYLGELRRGARQGSTT